MNKIGKERLMIPGAYCLKNVKQGKDMSHKQYILWFQSQSMNCPKTNPHLHFFAILLIVLFCCFFLLWTVFKINVVSFELANTLKIHRQWGAAYIYPNTTLNSAPINDLHWNDFQKYQNNENTFFTLLFTHVPSDSISPSPDTISNTIIYQ